MAKAFDPKKFAEAATAYHELVDKTARAIVEDARREFERTHAQTKERAAKEWEDLATDYRWAMMMGFALIAYIPRRRRWTAVNSADVPAAMKDWYGKFGETAPDWGTSLLEALAGLGDEAQPPGRGGAAG